MALINIDGEAMTDWGHLYLGARCTNRWRWYDRNRKWLHALQVALSSGSSRSTHFRFQT